MDGRKRKRRIQKKVDKRLGFRRFRGGSYERFARNARAIGDAAADALNRIAARAIRNGVIYKLPPRVVFYTNNP